MPWLVGTAFIHSMKMQERRVILKGWNVILIMVTFFLSIFGTFVVRSGILASVHAFALSAIGPYFLTFLALLIAGSLGLFFWRLPHLRADNQVDSLLSRESAFLINNLLFIGIAFAIFWGTIYPLVAEAVADQKVSVGPPYFKQVAGPLPGATLLLIGAGVVGSQVYQQETQATLAPGQSVSLGRYTLVANGIQTSTPPGLRVVDAPLSVNGEELHPQKQFFDNFPQQPSTKVGLR